ncbi:glycosyltransferase [Planktothrix agardhii 1033]|nr:glycosyltransferase [Planktothrix agardhii 1033]
MARVTVIIPTYNQDSYISEAIDSVLNQTYQDFEIVITNDGSTDQTLQIIQGKKDPRIRYFSFDQNQGVSTAANHCIRQARGELIAILDSDNIFLPDKLEKQVSFLDYLISVDE